MSIRDIARELYRLEKEVAKLEKELDSPETNYKRELELKDRLRNLMAERRQMKNILEGAKQEPKIRMPR